MGVKTTGIVTLVLALAGCGGAPQSIDRLVVQLALQKDGSLQARETWTLGPGDGDASTLSVDFPRQYHDGLSDVHQGATTPVTFRRQYVAAHTLALTPGRAHLTWPVLPDGHRWRIREVQVEVAIPHGIATVGLPGIAEAGWTVTAQQSRIDATRKDVAPGETATLIVEFSREGLSAPEPEWQFVLDRAEEFKPAFMSAAAFILIVGVAVLGLLRVLVSVQGRQAAIRGLRVAGIVFLILGALLAVLVTLTLDAFGAWTLSIPASIALVGAMFAIAGSRRVRV